MRSMKETNKLLRDDDCAGKWHACRAQLLVSRVACVCDVTIDYRHQCEYAGMPFGINPVSPYEYTPSVNF